MNKIWILFKREYRTAVKTKSFIISLILVPVLMGGSFVVMSLMQDNEDINDKSVVVIDHSGLVTELLKEKADERNKTEVFDPETGEQISPMHKLDENGEEIKIVIPDSDSGIYLRGSSKSQVNIWCWPIGSGEVYGYRMDQNMSAEVRKGVTPIVNADHNIGEWNTFRIEVVGNFLTVDLNGQRVLDKAELPGLPEKGAIALQHHGNKIDGEWAGPPSLVQFKNIRIAEL